MLVRINIPEKSKGGIVLPNASSQNPSAIVEGTVLKVGPGGWFDGKRLPMQCEAGDVVLFQQQQAMSIKIGEDFNRKEDGAIVILAEPFILTREPNR
jgi:chaperonin GroES